MNAVELKKVKNDLGATPILTNRDRLTNARKHYADTAICHHDHFRSAPGYGSTIICLVCGRRGTHQNDGNHGW